MQKTLTLMALICIMPTTILAQATKAPAKAADPVPTHRNLVYATVGRTDLHLDLYLPNKSDAQTPLVVWIHGGGWRAGNKDSCSIAWLAGKGYAVASVQYRLSDKAKFPAQIHDCKGAIRWLRANAKKYGYNGERVGAAGISAGGHLVALLGTSGGLKDLEGEVGGNADQSSRVQAVLDMCGPSDFLLRNQLRPAEDKGTESPVALLLGGTVAEKTDLARQASPAQHLSKDDAPLLIYHGDKDPLVDLKESQHLQVLYKKTGLEVALEIIPGGGHVPKEFSDQSRQDLALKFFNQHLRPAPRPVTP